MTIRLLIGLALAAVLTSAAPGSTTARPPVFTGTGTIVFSCAGCPQVPSRGELYTVSASGRGFRRLRTTSVTPYSPSWSPDGRSLAFHAGSSLWRMRVRPSGKVVRLTRQCDLCDRDPTWSPDGRTIAFIREGALYTVPAEIGIGPRLLRRGRFESPDWAPNGRLIAIHDAGARLHVIRPDGRGLRRVGRVLGRLPRWSPDGQRIAFIGQVGTAHAVMVVRPDGTGRRVIARPRSLASGVGPAWSPDGRHILFVVAEEFEPGQSGREFRVASLATRSVRRIAIPQLPRNVFADVYGLDWTR
jgi:Tol biopolymer transport system component